MTEVNSAYKHGRYERTCLKSVCVMPSVENVATADGERDVVVCWLLSVLSTC